MTDITSLSIPKELIHTARDLGINCSKVARDAITAAIKEHSIKNIPAPIIHTGPVVEG
jgi:post-segregation antitoxin (ccd killing protein)